MLLNEQGRASFGSQNDEFLKGQSFLKGSTAIEDMTTILTSTKNVQNTLRALDFTISYHETKNFLTKEKFDYPAFRVNLDSAALQVTSIPVYIQIDTVADSYSVKAEGKNVSLYNYREQLMTDEFIADWSVEVNDKKMGEAFTSEYLSFNIEFPEDRIYDGETEYHFIIHSIEDQARYFKSKLGIEPLSDESNIVVLSTAGGVVSKEKKFLDKLMDTYIATEKQKRKEKGLKTIGYIDELIGEAKDSLAADESEVLNAVSAGGSFDPEGTSAFAQADISRLKDQQAQENAKLRYLKSIQAALNSSDDFVSIAAPRSSGIDDPGLNSQVQELTRLNSEIASRDGGALLNNPQVISMKRKLRSLRGSLKQTASGLVRNTEFVIQDLKKRIGENQYKLNVLPSSYGDLTLAQREADLSEELYTYLKEKRADAGIAIASDQIDKVVVDNAALVGNKAISPNKKMVLGGALLLGMILPLGFILVKDLLDDTIADVDELKRVSNVPVLASIPSGKRKRITPDEPQFAIPQRE